MKEDEVDGTPIILALWFGAGAIGGIINFFDPLDDDLSHWWYLGCGLGFLTLTIGLVLFYLHSLRENKC